MNDPRRGNIRIYISAFLAFVLLGCSFSGYAIRYRSTPRFDPPPFSLQQAVLPDPATSTVLIHSPTPSKTGTPTETKTLTLTASPTSSLTSTWTLWPSLTPFPTLIKTNTRVYYPTITKTWTVVYIPPPIDTKTPTWTNNPPLQPSSTASATNTTAAVESPGETSTPSSTPLGGGQEFSATSTPSFTPFFTFTFTYTVKPASTSSGCSLVYNSDYESRVIALVNNERQAAGLPVLTMHSSLMSSARGHSVDMAVNNYMSHTGSDGSTAWQRMQAAGYVGRWGGENIWVGYSNGTPEAAMSWWMNSQAHKDNILGVYYRDIGVGYAYCATGTYRHYYSINFGAP